MFGYDKAKSAGCIRPRDRRGGRAIAHHPEALAERVYGLGNPTKAKELGNIEPGDGYRCRGAGMLQLTGRGAHRRIGAKTGFDLAGNPGSARGSRDLVPGRGCRIRRAEMPRARRKPTTSSR
jgi:predicted chitinase